MGTQFPFNLLLYSHGFSIFCREKILLPVVTIIQIIWGSHHLLTQEGGATSRETLRETFPLREGCHRDHVHGPWMTGASAIRFRAYIKIVFFLDQFFCSSSSRPALCK